VKIDEVMINEGVFDKLAAGVAGAKAAYQAGGQRREGEAKQKELADTFIQDWNEAIAQDPASATPEFLKQFMHNSTRQSGITVPEPPSTINSASAAAYITKVIGQAMAARRLRANIGGGNQTTADTPTPAAKAAEKPTLTPGFTMVDDDPVVLKYKNQDYVRNDKGQWAPMLQPTKPIVDSAVAKMFDKQEQAIDTWKSGDPATTPPAATPPASSTSTPAPASDATTPASAAEPDTRTQADLRSPKGIKDPGKEVFIPGHGIVQKQDDGSWRSLPNKAPVNPKDWPALEKRLTSATTDAPAAGEPTAEPATSSTAEPAAAEAVGAPIDSTTTVGNEEVKVTFKKSDEGWRNAEPTKSSTVHKPGTKQYDALERHWAKQNNKPQPAPTVGQSTTGQTATKPNYAQQTKGGTGYGAAGAGMANLTGTPTFKQPISTPEPALAESFKRLNRITHGKI
jgi:hypothetical protein